MRLDRLDLTRYGRFTDRSLTFAPPAPGAPDLHIVYGPNEAGKSTLFSAWLDFLFGIPLRTRYDFQHAGPSLQIGAGISHAGGALDLKRLKRNAGSLLDRFDAPVADAVLHGVLGGLTREGYSAMFSLDDETLEQGGDSILASRGDLGEMLFSASAGLSGLAPQLEGLRAELDGFHRAGKRSGVLYDAKKHLAELEKQRRAVEVSAGAIQRMSREAEAAEATWAEARAAEGAAQRALDRLQAVAAALPLRAQRAAREARLAPLAALPDAGEAEVRLAEKFEAETREIAARRADRAQRCEAARAELQALPQDEPARAAAPAIAEAEALRAAHDAAVSDLPRRQDEAAEAVARVQGILAQLGQAGAEAGALVVPDSRLSVLRGLLAARSGLTGAVTSTSAERAKAAEALARAEADAPEGEGEEEALAALLGRLRAQDPAEALARARRERDAAQGEVEAALAGLAPWRGDGAALAALGPPVARQLDEWEQALEAERAALADARREAEALADQRARAEAEGTARAAGQGAAGLTLADAARARSAREALWSAHRAALTPETAQRFEQALREDDRISAALAEALAEDRRTAEGEAARAALAVRQAAAGARAEAAEARRAGVVAAIHAALAALGLPPGTLADLRGFMARREGALAAVQALAVAGRAVDRAQAALADAARALAELLGTPPAADSYEALRARALARVDAAAQRREARKRLAERQADLTQRRQAEDKARADLDAWRRDWAEASGGTLLAGQADAEAGLGTVLDLLDQLGQAHRAALALGDRVAKMQANRQRFLDAKAGVLAALGAPEATPWADVTQRLRRAEDAARDRERLERTLAQEERQDGVDRRALAARDEEARALGAQLGWSPDDGPLSAHAKRCHEAAGLRAEIVALTGQLHDAPAPAEGEDAAAVAAEVARLKAELAVLRQATEARLAAHLDARRQLDAVGGDDALARIVAERETLLLELRERATAHLARRFGLIAFEAGLRRYRDHHRSAMLTRASEAFSALSRGAYAGLAAQPDGNREVLVALPAGGGAKLAADLSKGTRFQLYLALRIAGYHEMAQSRPTVPFIADDIMETFDDDRSAAAFGLLAEMSRVGQVIYLTHHRHLCDIAREAAPGAQVIDLQAG